MADKVIAVISASGFLGVKTATAFKSPCYKVIPTYFPKEAGEKGVTLDVTKGDAVNGFVERFSPDAVVNCSAITAVDWCEEHRKECSAVNLGGAKNIALACRAGGAKLVHFSTGSVFAGKKGSGGRKYLEDDEINPVNFYSKTKAESDKFVMETLEDPLVIRIIDLYGFNSKADRQTFVTWVLRNLRSGKEFGVVNDQFSHPTLIDDVASAALRLLEMGERGVFHVFGSDYISKYCFALKIADAFGLDSDLIKPISTAESPLKAKRPMTVPVSTEKAAALGIKPRSVDDGLRLMKEQMQQAGAL